MCRSIKRLRRADELPTEEELNAAALQFVRKISGYHAPSKINRAAFERAIHEVAAASRQLFDTLSASPIGTPAPGTAAPVTRKSAGGAQPASQSS